METRKLQLTGGSTYIVSLPKRWVSAMGIAKNDAITIIERNDGTLLLSYAKGGKKGSSTSITVNMEEKPMHLQRRLIGAYIGGYRKIEVRAGKGQRIEPNIRKQVRKFTSSVIGPEIVDERIDRIVLRDLLNPLDLEFDESIKRMYHIIKNMHQSVMLSLKEGDDDLAADVVARDVEVNKLYWLVCRQVNTISYDPIMAQRVLEEHDFSPRNTTHYMMMARLLERIGDHACRIANNVMELGKQELPSGPVKKTLAMNESIIGKLEKCINVLNEPDSDIMNRLIDELIGIREKEIPELDKAMARLEVNQAVCLGNILDSNNRTAKYTIDVAETIIDLAMALEPDDEEK